MRALALPCLFAMLVAAAPAQYASSVILPVSPTCSTTGSVLPAQASLVAPPPALGSSCALQIQEITNGLDYRLGDGCRSITISGWFTAVVIGK